MPAASIQRCGSNCHCPLAGAMPMVLLHRKIRQPVRLRLFREQFCSPRWWVASPFESAAPRVREEAKPGLSPSLRAKRSNPRLSAGIDGLLRCARNDVDTVSRSRGADRPRFASSFGPLRNRGRREDRVLAAPAVSCAICANKYAHEHTGQREHSGLPCAMALRLTSCSPRRTALLPPLLAFPPT
jgi:hypothetical protein